MSDPKSLIIRELQNNANASGYVTLSHNHLAEIVGCSKVNVKYHIKNLIKSGFISIAENRSAQGMPNLYKLRN